MDSALAAVQCGAKGECASPPLRKRFLAAKPSQVLYNSVTTTLTSMSSGPKLFKLHVITRIFFFLNGVLCSFLEGETFCFLIYIFLSLKRDIV